ncbi:hypothetical protein [Mycoplasmopsis synoviae]|uniref:hypothetical protein n=2 Tax=Mycoplasmopsis synoviae TaxID=2109 RepID=UPI000CA33524|nr:hypothetical protein [Mycoplasmopsis synoviae]AQT41473.1 putative phase-variable hemagglutinin [Mycoplasmopsis synoviae]UZF64544.1 hypothetical protein N0B76_01245 [Mycoplasmopsis synoviae]UZF65215.1 hypothetical protein N0B75_01250 [Mycoplasmopsis synoviae]
MQFTSGSVTAAKAVKDDAQYDSLDATLKTTLEEKYTAATALLEDGTKLANLNADGTLATTQSDLESAKTALDAAVAAVKPDLDFQKTKTSATAKVTELESLVNTALKTELQRQVTALDKDQAAQATTMLENLTSLKESLESLQTLVSNGLKMQVDYPQKYYDADNKADFDAALLKASSVFPAFKWTTDSIVVPAPIDGALPNPRAWTKARDKSEFVLQNFVMAPAPAQAAPAAQSDSAATAAASATVRLANGEAASGEAQTTPAPASMADLASTVSYLKTLDTDLKAQTAALNGDTTTNKTAYYKLVDGRTLYWDGFMPKIVVPGYEADGEGNGKATHETTNQQKLQQWFATESNWEKLSEQLTKKLGSDKFKNVTLTNPQVSYEEVTVNSNTWKNPKVTFTVEAKPGYELTQPTTDPKQISLTIRVLYSSHESNQNLLTIQGASSSAAPRNATVNDPNVKSKVNVYLNYTGPSIVLDADLPTVGEQENTSINGTSNVTGDFNTAFRGNPSSGLLFTNRYPNPLLKSVINYVNKFDPKYRAEFVTNSKNGVTITKVESGTQLRPGTLDDLNKNNVFLQQIKGDKEAVYFAVSAIASNNWLNTFLIRIPLTKFVRPITPFRAPAAPAQSQGGQTETSQPAQRTGQSQ